MELHFSPGVKGCEEDRNIPTGFGFRPASAEVSGHLGRSCQPQGTLGALFCSVWPCCRNLLAGSAHRELAGRVHVPFGFVMVAAGTVDAS